MNPEMLTPSPEEIATCAYFIWEQEGRPQGRDKTHWLQAEELLRTNHLSDPATLPETRLIAFADPSPPKSRRDRRRARTSQPVAA